MSEKLLLELNNQINEEAFSGYLYFSMSAYFENIGLKGMAKWMFVQGQEELTHSQRFYMYILQRGWKVNLKKIEGPQVEWKSPLDAFEAALKHEQHVTGRINLLTNLAIESKDHATKNLEWFVNEQVEEEANANDVINQLKLVKDNPAGLFMIDKELGTRTFTPAPISGLGQTPAA